MSEFWKTPHIGRLSRQFLYTFSFNLLIALCLGLFVVYLSAQNRVIDLLEDERIFLEHTQALIHRDVSDLRGDLLGLADSTPVRAYAEMPNDSSRSIATDAFVNLLRHSQEYQQARYLSPQGEELIRVQRQLGNRLLCPRSGLQDKSDRYYFKNGIALTAGQVYLSPLDLNIENGLVERPFNPVMRLATPVYDNAHTLKGLLVLNYSANRLLSMLETILSGGRGEPMLVNGDGFWLYHRNQSLLWGFMFGSTQRFDDVFPEAWGKLQTAEKGQFRTKNGSFVFRAVDPLEVTAIEDGGAPGLQWYLVSHIRPSQLLIGRMWAMIASWLGLLVVIIGIGACALIAKFYLAQLASLAALRKSEEHSRGLLDGAPDGILLLDPELKCLEANRQACQLFGRTHPEMIGRDMGAVVGQLTGRSLAVGQNAGESEAGPVAEVVVVNAEGRQIPVEVSSRYLADGRWQGFLRDVSERKESERSKMRAEAVFLNTAEGIIITDPQGCIVDVNPAFIDISGYDRHELIGNNPSIQQSGRHDEAFYRNLWGSLAETGSWIGEIWNQRKNGEIYAAWENIAAVRDEFGQIENYIAIISDISSIKDAESRLVRQANEDALTGLMNRRAFGLALDKAIDRAKRHGYKLALLYLDLDRFKLVNDTLGHDVGDQLLKQVASTLEDCVRSEDVVGRLGGDEFTVLIENISTPEDAAVIAQNLIRVLANPVTLEGQEFVIPASIGIAVYPRDGRGAGGLAKAADAAMYRAKAHGRGTYEFYTADMTNQAVMRFETEAALRQALINDEFELHYQPQWALDGLSVVGVEALIRWRHPERGLLGPGAFISVAEESNLINQIGSWVIQEACRQYAQWRAAGLEPLKVAVNLSGRQLIYGDVPSVFRDCQNTLATTIPGAFEFEVTETILQSGSRAVSALAELRSMGAVVAIDDFGKGYSSLGHLSQLPVDTLKIDQGFVRGLPGHDTNSAIVRAVISMAHSMGLAVVAEGVEEESQLRFLQGLVCDYGQGYLFSKPVPAADIVELVKTSRTEVSLR